jgi:hypothetical protein
MDVRLGQGTEKPEAGHLENEVRGILVFTKRVTGLLKEI